MTFSDLVQSEHVLKITVNVCMINGLLHNIDNMCLNAGI